MLQLWLGNLSAELVLPKKYESPEAEGFREFIEQMVTEMKRGLRAQHADNIKRIERKAKNEGKKRRKNLGTRDLKADAGATPIAIDSRRVRGVE